MVLGKDVRIRKMEGWMCGELLPAKVREYSHTPTSTHLSKEEKIEPKNCCDAVTHRTTTPIYGCSE